MRMTQATSLAATLLGCMLAFAASAEPIKIGVVKTGVSSVIFIGIDKGYFADAGVPAEVVFFESAQPIAVAAASGAIDFGMTAPSGGFYNLAGQGALRIIAGGVTEVPGFNGAAYLVSAHAWDGGLRSLKDFAGHSFGVSQVGSPPHYELGLLAEKYRLDLKTIRIVPLQSIANIASGVAGGQVDETILTQSPALLPAVERGDIKRLGWVGNETPWQFNLTFTATKTAADRADMVKRFLTAYRRSTKAFHDAFTGPDGKPKDGEQAPEFLAIMGKYLNQSPAEARLGVGYFDPEARLDVADVLHQIAWFKEQGMLKLDGTGEEIIDKRYVIPMPHQGN